MFLERLRFSLRRAVGSFPRLGTRKRSLSTLVDVHEEELRRLGLDVHDIVSGEIVLLAIEVERLVVESVPPNGVRERRASSITSRLGHLKDRVLMLDQRVREVSRQLYPSILDHLGLEAALRSECARVQELSGVNVSFEATAPTEVEALGRARALCLYRVAQEALRNAVKHSGTDRVLVELTVSESRRAVALLVKDWGVGIDSDVVGASGMGLVGMRERVQAVQGVMELQAPVDGGTEVRVSVPVDAIDQIAS